MMRAAFLIFCCLLIFSGEAHAASDSFKVSLRYGTDVTPPSVPANLSAVPVASTQIDLSWNPSTDDNGVDGYSVFRDSVQIATTTLTSYSDSGLSASTLYTYFVRAFDEAGNTSSSSNSVATTTLELTATSTPPSTDDNDAERPEMHLVAFAITPEIHGARFSWRTDRYAQFELRWGRTTSYESGFIVNDLYKTNYETAISDLQSATAYQYELIAYDRHGNRYLLSQGSFTTLSAPDNEAPANVHNLTATVRGEDVLLSWRNPAADDFSRVRIVRSYLFYPSDTQDGLIVYEGRGDSFTDRGALSSQNAQYYTVFAYDKNGNVSSGAVVLAHVQPLPPAEASGNGLGLSFGDIEVVQGGTTVDPSLLYADEPFSLRIAFGKLPQHLKSVIADITRYDGSVSSYLLRINQDRTYYEASIEPLGAVGEYPTTVRVYDFEQNTLDTVSGTLTAAKESSSGEWFGTPLVVSSDDQQFPWYVILLLLVLLFMLYLLRLLQRVGLLHKGARAAHLVSFAAVAVSTGALALFLLRGAPAHQEAQSALSDVPAGLLLGIFAASALCAIALLFFARSR